MDSAEAIATPDVHAVLITVGDELLIGQVVDTNAAWLGDRLTAEGIVVLRTETVGDRVHDLRSAVLRVVNGEGEIVILTGGLGPTRDDLTRFAVSSAFNRPLQIRPEILTELAARFGARGREMPRSNRIQAFAPIGFEVLPNALGSAPGLWYRFADRRAVVLVPGVPREMQHLIEGHVLPRIREGWSLPIIAKCTMHTVGIAESRLQDLLDEVSDQLSSHERLAFLPSLTGVRIRAMAYGDSADISAQRLSALRGRIVAKVGRYIYGEDGETLAQHIGRTLTDRGLTVAAAESCTGGHITDELTHVAGSSAYVMGGVVAYSNRCKFELLGVSESDLERHGAVSETVALQMARGVRERLGSDIGLSTTGILGPGGGTPEKPVGTVWIGLSDRDGTTTSKVQLIGDRLALKARTTTAALNYLRLHLNSHIL